MIRWVWFYGWFGLGNYILNIYHKGRISYHKYVAVGWVGEFGDKSWVGNRYHGMERIMWAQGDFAKDLF